MAQQPLIEWTWICQ